MREKAKEKYVPVKYNPTRICINCGTEFSVGSKSKRELCDCCYKKDLAMRMRIAKNKFKNKEIEE